MTGRDYIRLFRDNRRGVFLAASRRESRRQNSRQPVKREIANRPRSASLHLQGARQSLNRAEFMGALDLRESRKQIPSLQSFDPPKHTLQTNKPFNRAIGKRKTLNSRGRDNDITTTSIDLKISRGFLSLFLSPYKYKSIVIKIGTSHIYMYRVYSNILFNPIGYQKLIYVISKINVAWGVWFLEINTMCIIDYKFYYRKWSDVRKNYYSLTFPCLINSKIAIIFMFI